MAVNRLFPLLTRILPCGKERLAFANVSRILRLQQNNVVQLCETSWNLERMKGLVFQGEKLVRREGGAGSVLAPFMVQQREIGSDIQILLGVCGATTLGTEDRIGAIVILWPQAVHHEFGMGGALRARALNRAELRRPGEIQEIESNRPGPPLFCPRAKRAKPESRTRMRMLKRSERGTRSRHMALC